MANTPQPSGGQTLRPPAVGPMSSQNFGSPYPMQFRPMAPAPQGQHLMPVSSAPQQFSQAGQGMQSQPLQYSQPMQHLQSRPLQSVPIAPSQASQMPYHQQNMTFPQQFHQAAPSNGHVFGGPGAPLSSSYTYAASYGQPQNTMNMSSQFQPVSQVQMPVVPAAGQPWLQSGTQGLPVASPVQPTGQQPAASPGPTLVVNSPHTASDWQEFEASDGRRYYYNKITKQSCWEKPLELMTPLERADASTVWKEFTTAEGRKYYYNKITKQSKWSIPDELKLAREQAEKAAINGSQSESVTATAGTQKDAIDVSTSARLPTEVAAINVASSTTIGVATSPVPVTPISAPVMTVSESSTTPVVDIASDTTTGVNTGSVGLASSLVNVNTTPVSRSENPVSHDVGNSVEGASVQDMEEAKKGMAAAGKTIVTPVEDKIVEDEPPLYANKQEAKNAFKALLESANVEADWNWEQAMRVIINDKRYGALKTLGERKQAFNEYLMQRKKLEAEERRLRQRKAKEEFTKMLEESRELTSSMRWSKAASLFENDERFKAVERASDREDLFKNYLVDLQKKEKAKAQEEYRQNRLNFRKFLETCGLIKVDTQWRKVQDRMEESESGSRLEKIDRLDVFQEYIRDLEKEEEEQRKIKKEQIKRVERKNRDEFRKMLEEHVASGTFTAKTLWCDYCQKVKDSAPYHAVALNLSGSTPKELFEDVSEDLQRQYDEDKAYVKDALKSKKISVASTWTFEDFKNVVAENIDSLSISDINMKLVFDDLLERVKEKEEKEAKKRQRLAEDFSDKLSTIKEISASSDWDECKQLFEGSSEYRSIKDESSAKQIFEEHIALLQEKAREKERKREEEKVKKEREKEEKEKRKEKEKREKEREHEKDKEKGVDRSNKDDIEAENLDVTDNYVHKEDKKREKDRERKHRKRQHIDVNSDKDDKEDSYKKSRRHGSEDEKEDSKKSRRHGSDDEIDEGKKSNHHVSDDEKDTKRSRRHGSSRRKSRKHAYTPESDGESRHKRHKRDHRDGSRKNGGHEELEDGEVGEDGEIQ